MSAEMTRTPNKVACNIPGLSGVFKAAGTMTGTLTAPAEQ